MQRGLITRDYTLAYVAEHGSSTTPPLFNVATMWSALEGSILLWGLVLAGYLAVVAHKFRSRLDDPLVGWALITLFVIAIFFFGLMLTAANPFIANVPPPGYDGPGPEPAAAEPHPDGLPPADALPGLRRLLGALRLRHRGARHRSGRRGVARRDPSMDALRLGVPDRGHHPGGVVELRGPRVGRLLGMGSGRERLVASVADGNRIPPLGDGAGAPRTAAGLEPVPAVRHVLAHHPRHVPHPLRRRRVGPRVLLGHGRPAAARLLRVDRRRLGRPDRLARRPAPLHRHASTRRCRARAPSSPTTSCSLRSRSSCCSARCSPW